MELINGFLLLSFGLQVTAQSGLVGTGRQFSNTHGPYTNTSIPAKLTSSSPRFSSLVATTTELSPTSSTAVSSEPYILLSSTSNPATQPTDFVSTAPTTGLTSSSTTLETAPHPTSSEGSTATITIPPTFSEVTASKSAVQSQLSSIVPAMQGWIDKEDEDTSALIGSLDDLEKDARTLIAKLDNEQNKPSKHCTSSSVSILDCMIKSVTSIKTNIVSHLKGIVQTELATLASLSIGLQESTTPEATQQKSTKEKSTPETKSSQASTTSTTSTSTCTSGTSITQHYYVTCTPTTISSTKTELCQTSTSTITGCSVAVSTTVTTVSTTATLCAQSGCLSCTSVETRPSETAACVRCVTSNGRVYPPQATTVPKGVQPAGKSKRTLLTPYEFSEGPFTPEDYDNLMPHYSFFIAQLADPGLVNVPHRAAFTGGSSSALLPDYRNDRITMTVQGLYGCTSVILISRRGVYMSHLFENPGFEQYIDPNGMRVNTFDEDIAFKLFVGDEGSEPMDQHYPQFPEEPWLPNLEDVSSPGEIFDPAQRGGVRVILVTPGPESGVPNAYKYPHEIERLRDMFSRFETAETPTIPFIYTTTNNELSNNQYLSTGKILFQFDPLEAIVMEYGCPRKYAGIKVWIDHPTSLGASAWEPFYEDNWIYEHQSDDMERRQERPEACVAVSSEAAEIKPTASQSLPVPSSRGPIESSARSHSSQTVLTVTLDGVSTLITLGDSGPTTLSTITSSSIHIQGSGLPLSSTSTTSAAMITYSLPVVVTALPADATSTTSANSIDWSTIRFSYVPATPSSSEKGTPTDLLQGECDVSISRDPHGVCQWKNEKGIVQTGACPADAACSKNGAACTGGEVGSVKCT
ncbi:hypothetical protein CKM354_001045700 [Cercospora kikuchii]|uniref:Uncharacterized protein n=1 Tax=Cercospora kikuchii TaxID=84275 RepID=A0A9P3CMQ3_9PEZI|nr:uncharacterized protein CKM354_001045700 [Cercospora kikuchii]GIZ47364.1 hypothetical protein CKM354_001045700 [Cercospora kikuchii]